MYLLGEEVNEEFEEIINNCTREEFNEKYVLERDEDDDDYNLYPKDSGCYIGCPFHGSDCHANDNCKECWEEFIDAAKFKDEFSVTTVKSEAGILVNEITKYLDKHLKPDRLLSDVFCNCIYETPIDGQYLIRYPGATRGSIVVDSDMIIVDVRLGIDSFIYQQEVTEGVKRFVGRKLIF